ncbi:MAG TPA: hypothetical protein VLW65_20065 [Bryobacteraceae bacterium]|nr:hypothetical protein [Bryobacteraceae bacterium]
MATTIEIHAAELAVRNRGMSKVAAGVRNHWTLFAGMLYVTTIVVVLVLVARY